MYARPCFVVVDVLGCWLRVKAPHCHKSGQVEIRRNGRLLDTLTEQSIFGETGLIDQAPRRRGRCCNRRRPGCREAIPVSGQLDAYFALNVMRMLTRPLRSANGAT